MGRDSRNPWVQSLFLAAVNLVFLLVIFQYLDKKYQTGNVCEDEILAPAKTMPWF